MTLKYKHPVLLVDDEESIINSLQRLFRKERYHILTASSGNNGLELLKKMEKPISLIISDQRMPGMSGAEFLEKAKKIFPDAVRFLLTGYSDLTAVMEAVNRGEIHRYLTKPWDDDDLKLQVRQSLKQYELQLENRRLAALTRKQNKQLKELNSNLEQKVEARSREILQKNKELESTFFNTVRAFASLTEMYAPSLAGHGRRVSLLSRETAIQFDLPNNEVTHVEIAGLLHDIGKLGFPKKLIKYEKKKWNSEEQALFRNHSVEGQTIVRFINRLDHVGLLIRSHHERYDGKGYPDQLSEDIIPLGSQIISVVNAYDKVVNMSVNAQSAVNKYQASKNMSQDHLPEEELREQAAIHYLKQNAFTRFAPEVIKEFLEVLKTKGVPFKKEKRVAIDDLKPGMALSESLYSSKGRFLLPHDTVLTPDHIKILMTIHQNDPIIDTVQVTVN